jgi:hypothetical protein
MLYPNPVKDYFIIQLPELLQNIYIDITITDLLGRPISQFNTDKRDERISVINYTKEYILLK